MAKSEEIEDTFVRLNREIDRLNARIAELEHTIEQLSQDIERRTKMYVDLEAENQTLKAENAAMKAELNGWIEFGDKQEALETENQRLRDLVARFSTPHKLEDCAQLMRDARAALEETKPEPKIGEDIKCIGCGKELCGHEESFCMKCITGEIPKMIIAGLDKLEKRVEALEESNGQSK